MTGEHELKVSVESEKGIEDKPKDRFSIVYILFFLLGLVHILPWTFFVTAHDYWMKKFRNTSFEDVDSAHRTVLQTEFSPSLTITLQISTIVFLILTLFFGHKYSLKLKLFGTLSVVLTCFVISAIFILVDTDTWQVGFFALTMFLVAVINAMGAIFGMAAYSMIAQFSRTHLSAYLLGTATATIFTSCLQVLSLSIGISTESSALVYFWVATAVIASGLVLMILVERFNKCYRANMKNYQEGAKKKMLQLHEIIYFLKKIWKGPAIMGFWLITVTSVHTGITSMIVSEGEGNGEWNDVYFVPVITFVLPAFGDIIGRVATIYFNFKFDSIWLVAFSGLRMFIFIPLLMLCNAQPRHHLPVIFSHDYQYIIIMIFFSITNGYLINMASLIIPRLVPPEQLEDAYHVNLVVGGILLGVLSFISFVTVDLI